MSNVRSCNIVLLVGTVGTIGKFSPSRKENGKGYCSFSLATNEKFADGKQRTDWHSIFSWGRVAEFIRDNLTIGSLVQVTGKLRVRVVDKDGQKKKYVTVESRDIVVLNWKGREEEKPPAEEEGER